ncbi:ribonucleoside-diphosphate reductase beta chain [Planifilum fulgidum]|uniref:R2-like ligand binding oxidase n=1 Tax=Planifilum fulgidum TaxID=201973 RepID=A0A1I2RQ86_9BACL|nr:R2-like ligand-binding oxidase [Planifilum fulgidum]MBO2497976.1 ribonucleotide-diphosphate reductase [Bacillota bacterium]MBO2533412.1 ribonucleotide-diphosphate reductase [Thermoactinomycetaceae bacterium]SFG42682.1 ribonucleoside-diphosphate reductase beta chain [Planifilum fulgidum]
MRELTTSKRGLDHSLLPMRLYHKAKKLGVWDPQDIDLTQDKKDWEKFNDVEKEMTLRLCAMFQAGEEAVTRDLLPLIQVISNEGRLEEEMYLTTFLFEEAKHTEIFRRFLDEVGDVPEKDLSVYHLDNYRKMFYEYLPQAMERLNHDPSPEAQAEASVTYNMIVEGVLAETGYYSTFQSYKRLGIMPGTVQAFHYLQRDESRHIAYGVYLLQRLIIEHDVWDVVQKRMEFLLPVAIGIVNELINQVDELPFGLDKEEMIQYAMKQFDIRMSLLERARGKSAKDLSSLSEETMKTVKEEF